MKVLVINCGSSTIKYQLIDMAKDEVIAKGRCDKIGYEDSNLIYKNLRDGKKLDEVPVSMPDHKVGMKVLLDTLQDEKIGVISDINEISAIGHRVVAGGEKYNKAVIVDDNAIREVASSIPNVVVFDTAFHQTMPDYNYLYAIDKKYYTNNHIRRYGAHGTSYQYITKRLAKLMGKNKDEINAIICHIGGGASVCAIKNGKSYDTSMGYTPLEGLIMETRCGDIDPAVILKIMRIENYSVDEMDDLLNKKSGRIGFTGIGDFRLMKDAALEGNKDAILMRKMQTQRIKKYIGAYMAELNHVDAIVFTGGIMENNDDEIANAVSDMEELGIELDAKRNKEAFRGEGLVSTDSSRIKIYLIPTNEELEIANQTVELVKDM